MGKKTQKKRAVKKDRTKRNMWFVVYALILSSTAYVLLLCNAPILKDKNISATNAPEVVAKGYEKQPLYIEIEDEPPQPALPTATLLSTGDMLFHTPIITHNYDKESKTHNFDGVFDYVRPYCKAADVAVANLEVTLAGRKNGRRYSGFPYFNSPDTVVDALKNSGYDVLLTANNHAYDYGYDGLLHTQKVLSEKQTLYTGTRMAPEEKSYLILEANGINIGILNYTFEYRTSAGNSRVNLNGKYLSAKAGKLINTFRYDRLEKFYAEVEKYIDRMYAEGSDVIVVYLHWGSEYVLKPSKNQRKIAQKLCDLGVDVIVGGHPHVIQPIEHLQSEVSGKNTVCLYSTGNALSNQRKKNMRLKTGHTEDGVLFSVTFSRDTDGGIQVSKIEAMPTWVRARTVDKKRVYDILPLDKNLDWSAIYGLKSTKSLEASYKRTMDILEDGLNSFEPYKINPLRFKS